MNDQNTFIVSFTPETKQSLEDLAQRLQTTPGGVLSEAFAFFKRIQGNKVIVQNRNGQQVTYDYINPVPPKNRT